MARTFVRQSQISGSFASNDSLNYAARETAFSASSDLQADLNILRSVVKENFGIEHYIDSVTPYNLTALGEKVDDIMQVEAAFTGMVSMPNLSVDGTGSFGGDISAVSGSFTGNLSAVDANLSGDLNAANATLTGDLGAANATLSGDLSAVSGSFSADLSAVNAVLSGDLNAANATLSGDLSANDGSFSGALAVTGEISGSAAVKAASAQLTGNLQAVNGDFSGDVSAANLSATIEMSAPTGSFDKLSISGDTATRLYIVDADGSIKDEAKLTFDGSELAVDGNGSYSGDVTIEGDLYVNGTTTYVNTSELLVTDQVITIASGSSAESLVGDAGIELGNGYASILYDGSWNISDDLNVAGHMSASGNMSAINGSLVGTLSVDGAATLNDTLTVGELATLQNGLVVNNAAADFNADVTANKISIDGDVAQRLYIVDADGSIKDEGKLLFDGSDMLVDGGMKLTGSLEAVSGSFSGNLSAVNGSFSMEVSAATAELADMSISNGAITADAGLTITATNALTLADANDSITLTDAGNPALSGSLSAAGSIYQAFNLIDNQLSALGSGHQKEVHPIASPATEVGMSFAMPVDIQDDLNVYVNGILVHASGSADDSAAALALGVDAAKKNANTIVFAFELKAGDVVIFEKF